MSADKYVPTTGEVLYQWEFDAGNREEARQQFTDWLLERDLKIFEAAWRYAHSAELRWEYGVLYAWHEDINFAVAWASLEDAQKNADTSAGDKIVRRPAVGSWEIFEKSGA